MKLKLNEDGHIVMQDGMPVYEHTDGQDRPFDAKDALGKLSSATKKINDLTEEKTRHFTKAKALGEKLALFDGLDPDEAKQAIETVQTYKNKKLIDAGKVDEAKAEIEGQLKKFYGKEIDSLQKIHLEEKTALEKQLDNLKTTTARSIISAEFAKSNFFNGEKPKTILPPDIAYQTLGKNFKVEGEGDEARVVAYLNGEKILSTASNRIGEPAPFNEAMGVILDKYEMKDRILNTGLGGSGSFGESAATNVPAGSVSGQKNFEANIKDIASGKIKYVPPPEARL